MSSPSTSPTRLHQLASMDNAGRMKRTLAGLKGHLTRQIKKCEDLSQQSQVDYADLESYYQAAAGKFEQIKCQMAVLVGTDYYHQFIGSPTKYQGITMLNSAGGKLLSGPVSSLRRPMPADKQYQ